jgi:DNA-binding response OmpR family regulator
MAPVSGEDFLAWKSAQADEIRSIPVVIVSGVSSDELQVIAKRFGVLALTKPFDPEQLVELVASLVER